MLGETGNKENTMSNTHQEQKTLRQVAVWIDHREAIVINFKNAHLLREEEIFSEAGPHTHGGGWSQKKIESHRHAILDHFYEQVVRDLAGADEIVIYGPGQAKHELHQHILRSKALEKRVTRLITTDKLGDQQFIRMALKEFTSGEH
jgi:stalled ribosome rescue protein Dom34